MKIEKASIEGMSLKLDLGDFPSRQEAGRLVSGFKTGDYEIKRKRKKRSLDANAYAWVLIDKISAMTGVSKIEVYQQALQNIGGVSDLVCVSQNAFNRLKTGWEHKGLGWQCIGEPSKLPGCVNATLIYGSSVFDTAQMARLIDQLVQDAQALGIDTLTDRERSLLIDEWNKDRAGKCV